MDKTRIPVSGKDMEQFCQERRIRRLSLFGSVLHPDFTSGSDVDVLVEFETGHTPGLGFFTMQDDLARLFGRKVDLHTPAFLSRHFRDAVLAEAQVMYAQG